MKDTDQYESIADNCIEVGTLIDEGDTLLTLDISDQGDQSARQIFSRMAKQARHTGSGKCKIEAETIERPEGAAIRAMFDFDCTIEKLVFQMNSSPHP